MHNNSFSLYFIKIYSNIYEKNFSLVQTKLHKILKTKANEKILKTKAATLHKVTLNQKFRRLAYKEKLQKPLRKIKEKIQAKVLFEPIRKIQKQCKTPMVSLERNHRKISEEKSVFTNYNGNGKWNYTEGATQRCSKENVFWKYAANIQENTHAEVWCQ